MLATWTDPQEEIQVLTTTCLRPVPLLFCRVTSERRRALRPHILQLRLLAQGECGALAALPPPVEVGHSPAQHQPWRHSTGYLPPGEREALTLIAPQKVRCSQGPRLEASHSPLGGPEQPWGGLAESGQAFHPHPRPPQTDSLRGPHSLQDQGFHPAVQLTGGVRASLSVETLAEADPGE